MKRYLQICKELGLILHVLKVALCNLFPLGIKVKMSRSFFLVAFVLSRQSARHKYTNSEFWSVSGACGAPLETPGHLGSQLRAAAVMESFLLHLKYQKMGLPFLSYFSFSIRGGGIGKVLVCDNLGGDHLWICFCFHFQNKHYINFKY